MRYLQTTLFIVFNILLFSACKNEDSNENSKTINQGSIMLSGEDTSTVGTELKVGLVVYGREDLAGIEESLIILPEDSTITPGTPNLPVSDPNYVESVINFKDKENGFVLVLAENAISMSIAKNGVANLYACDSSFNIYVSCGNASLDIASKKATFIDTTVENTETNTILELNGSVSW